MSAISDKTKRQILKASLLAEYGLTNDTPIPKAVEIEEVFDNEITYNIDGQHYKAPYEIGENGKPQLGEPQKVLAQTVYTAMESLRTNYGEIIQEAGRRHKAIDSPEIKKAVTVCQDAIDSEDEAKAKKAIKEADKTLAWLKTLEAMKTEDSQQFPCKAFAYVPDTAKPDTWGLRLWESTEVTRKQLDKASASLSPGGYRGHKADIPKDALSAVKRTIREAYRSIDVTDEDMPKWVKESETRLVVGDYISLAEAKMNGSGVATVVVIQPGLNASKERYYPPEMLARDFQLFEGVKMYADHPTDAEDEARPERSIKDWVATLKNVSVNEQGQLIGEATIIESWMQAKLASLRDANLLEDMGISINAVGTATKGTIEGVKTNVVERIVRVRSVDFVTEPGAGGMVQMYEADVDGDVDIVSIDTLKERRPDLVKTIETEAKAEILKEAKKQVDLEKENGELKTAVETVTKERDEALEKITEAERKQKVAEAKSQIDEAISKSELPDAAKARLTESFKDKDTAEGITEAIKGEAEYVAALKETGKVKGMGPTQEQREASGKELRESFKVMHPEWTDAQIETAVSGR